MKAEPTPRRRTRADDDGKLCLWLKNEAGRRGVPVRRSFERWIGAIPEIAARADWTEVNILIVGRAAGRRYNREFRGRDYATNVLSFPYDPLPGEHSGLLGDIVICAPVVAREAREQRKDPRAHYAHLTVHGVLHLLGYDHETEDDAERMEALERQVLATLGIADPYAAHD
ncbi:MAG: rRNA maturation RNase YbeY [Rhodanobacteraceae bacterium]|jgi:probable rRNA maturation factor|nr:rRNA maturation RNase YbeY [Rhodanobacteraceae bacterium]